MYLSECFQGSSSGTWWPLCCWGTTCRTNSKKAATTSARARDIIVVWGRGTFWTYLYCLTTRSGKWRTIFYFPAMIQPEYQHTFWKGVTSRRCSYGLQVTWQCSIESNKPLKWSACLNPPLRFPSTHIRVLPFAILISRPRNHMSEVSYKSSLQTQRDKSISAHKCHTRNYTFTFNLKREEKNILPQASSCNNQWSQHVGWR